MNLINGKIYIGQHKGNKFNPKYLGSGLYINRVIKKYGKENFFVSIIHRCDSFTMMDKKEIYYIKKYDSRNPRIGYNLSSGGESGMRGCHHTKKFKENMSKIHKGKIISEETRQKLRESNKKAIHNRTRVERIRKANTGKKRTIEFREKMSKIMKGKLLGDKNPMYGKKRNGETKQKIRLKLMGRKHTKEEKEKIGIANKKVWATKKRNKNNKKQI